MENYQRLFKIPCQFVFRVCLLLFILSSSACTTVIEDEPKPTITSTGTLTPSSTVIWFPATSTATLPPTIPPAPTENFHPAIGNPIYSDDFSVLDDWSISSVDGARVTLGKNEITLTTQNAGVTVVSLNNTQTLQNGWVDTGVNVSLCKAADNYGLMIRAGGPGDAYRFMVNCLGQVKLERLKFGRPVTLVDWMQSGQVLPGSPLMIRLQVWTVQDELRFFVNEVFQFSTRDAAYPYGKVGFFANQSADTPVTVSFSDFSIYAIEPGFVLPKATPRPTATFPRRINPPVETTQIP
jgi:hypothetical protein